MKTSSLTVENFNYLKSKYFLTFLLASILSSPIFSADFIPYKIKDYSYIANRLMHGYNKNNLYKVKLDKVSTFLPGTYNIKSKPLRLLSKKILPGKNIIRLARYLSYKNKSNRKIYRPEVFFAQLNLGNKYTYVILDKQMIFTETVYIPKTQKIKDKLSKHFFISGLQNKIRYAGEFTVYKDPIDNKIFVILDNSSGTYQPAGDQINNLKELLEYNFYSLTNETKISFVTKTFKQ